MTHEIKKGTIVKIKGIPFELVNNTKMETNDNNYKLVFNQSRHFCENAPTHAQSRVSSETNNLSLESK